MKLGRFTRRIAMVAAFVLAVIIAMPSYSQHKRISTMGSEFWVTFMHNPYMGLFQDSLQLSLMVSSDRYCSVVVSNPRTGWSSSSNSVTPGSTLQIEIPLAQAYTNVYSDTARNYGLHVVATDSISLYAANYRPSSTDVSNILPQSLLGSEYVVQTYPPTVYFASELDYYGIFAIVATENGTVVDITPSVDLKTDNRVRPAGTPFSVTLNAGQVAFMRSNDIFAQGDVSGTRIKSRNCKKIAVFAGDENTLVPSTDTLAGDHVFEQMFPIDISGTQFIVTNTKYDNVTYQIFDVVRITALEDTTIVKKNNNVIDTLDPWQTGEYRLQRTEQAAFFETSSPAETYQYTIGNEVMGLGLGDPSMTRITPWEQAVDSVEFTMFRPLQNLYGVVSDTMRMNFLNIVAKTADVNNLRLDGSLISGWTTVAGNRQYSFARVWVRNVRRSHFLGGADFTAFAYGLGTAVSYAYPIGAAINRYYDMQVDSVSIADTNVRHDFGAGCDIEFVADVKFKYDSVLWNFGDGSANVKGDTVHHAYNGADSFTVSMLVYSHNLCDQAVDTLQFFPLVIDTINDTVRHVICPGGRFDTLGHTYRQAGYYTIVETDTASGCFQNLVIEMIVTDTVHDTVYRRICAGTSFDTLGRHFTTTGLHPILVRDPDSCYRFIDVNLWVKDTFRTARYDSICAGQTFNYEGTSYATTQTFVYPHTSMNGCDSNVVVHLFVKDTSHTQRFDTVCAGQTFVYRDSVVNVTKNFQYRHIGRNGCDSIVDIHLFVRDSINTMRYDTICAGQSFTYEGTSYTTTGRIYYAHITASGCDSNVIINLFVKDTFRTHRYDTICNGQSFNYEGRTYNTPQTFVHRHTSQIAGCDSNVVVHLAMRDTFHTYRYDTICAGQTFVYGDSVCTSSKTFNYKHLAHGGCDSTVTVHLFVKDTFRFVRNDTICAGQVFTYEGVPYTTSQTILYRHTASNGCDSNMVVNLYVKDTFHNERYDTICAGHSFRYADSVYTATGRYHHVHRAFNGCDSNVFVNLFVKDTFRSHRYDTICAGQPYTYEGVPYTTSQTFTYTHISQNGCDSNVVVHLVVNDTFRSHRYDTICSGNVLRYEGQSHTVSEVFTYRHSSANGCDSNVVVHLLVNDTLRDTISRIICNGERFDTNGYTYTSTGEYVQTYYSPDSCLNNLMINLNVLDTIQIHIDTTMCAGSVFVYGDSSYYTQGVHNQVVRHSNRCDIVDINIVVLDTLRDTVHPVVCAGASFDTNRQQYYRQGVYNSLTRDSVSMCFHNLLIDLTVLDTLRDTVYRTLCAGAIFDTNNQQYYLQGVYTQQHQDSVSRCYHNLVIDITVLDTLRDTVHRTVCAGGIFDTNGQSYYLAGMHTQQHQDPATLCYSNLVIDLTVLDTVRDTVYPVICAGDTYDTNGLSYSRTGVYTQYLVDSSSGCYHDLVVVLTVNDTFRDTVSHEMCVGDVYINGQYRFDSTGVYTMPYSTVHGCDSIIVVDIVVHDTVRDTVHRIICAGATYDTLGERFYLDSVYDRLIYDNTPCGQHYLTIFLQVIDTLRDTINRTLLAGTYFDTNGQRFYNQGTYMQRLRDSVSGCFHNYLINITVRDTLRDTVYRTVCAGVSFDTNGQSYYLPGFYSQLLRNPNTGAYNRLYIDLSVNDTIRDTITRMLCAGVSFDTNGQRFYQPGQYTQHLRQPDSCYNNLVINISVRDTLRDTIYRTVCAGVSFDTNGQRFYLPGEHRQYLRQPDSCYNNLVIYLSVNDTVRDTIQREVCAGASFDTNGQSFFLPGTFTQHLRQPDSCYNNLVIQLSVRDTLRDTIYRTICAGETFDTNGRRYARAGVYTQYLRDPVTRCYNDLVIFLTVNDTFRDHIYDTVCAGMPTTHNGISYFMPGTHLQRYQTVLGCDSIVAIHLFVLDTIRDTIYREVCAGAAFDTNGQRYYYQGIHTQHLRDSVPGCFHNLVIDLTVRDTIRAHVYDTVCEGETYRFNSVYYTTTGVYRHMMRTREGCDSITYLHLQVNPVALVRVYDTCYTGSYPYQDTVYTQPGIYRHLFQRVGTGCDSMVVLHLKFCDSILTKLYDTICNDSVYRFGDSILTATGVYYRKEFGYKGCDSIIELHLEVVNYPRVQIVDSGRYCQFGIATLKLITDGNKITWSAFPADSSLTGQEHNATIYVSPKRYTEYTVVVDSVPRLKTCTSTASVTLQKASVVKAKFKREPLETNMNSLQTTFIDISIGNVAYREWLFHESSPMSTDKRYEYDSIVWFTPLAESDSFRVRLVVANDVGCTDTTAAIYPILKADLWVPNAFTPDENLNTLFKVGAYNLAEYEIYIYNRAGLLVFHSTSPDESWDGTYKGQPCIPASYVYVINYKTKTFPKQPQKKVGSVLLIR